MQINRLSLNKCQGKKKKKKKNLALNLDHISKFSKDLELPWWRLLSRGWGDSLVMGVDN